MVALFSESIPTAARSELEEGRYRVKFSRALDGPAALVPVPTLPLFGLGILVSLLGLFGLRKLRQ